MHKNSYDKMEWFKTTYLKNFDKLNVLDIGSLDGKGDLNYSTIFNEPGWTYTGLDIQGGNNVEIVVADIYNWLEVEDKSYDVIISGQFFEHLEFFWLTMSEIERVLRPGGYLCIIAPSSGPKHGGNMPNCYRFHEDGLKAMAKYVDLKVLHASVDNKPEANPWNDACLVALKEGSLPNATQSRKDSGKDTKKVNDTQKDSSDDNLESRVNNLEDKLDLILDAIGKK